MVALAFPNALRSAGGSIDFVDILVFGSLVYRLQFKKFEVKLPTRETEISVIYTSIEVDI